MVLNKLTNEEKKELRSLVKKLEDYSHSLICLKKSVSPRYHKRCNKDLTVDKIIAYEISSYVLKLLTHGYTLQCIAGLEDVLTFSKRILDYKDYISLNKYIEEIEDFICKLNIEE